MAVDRPLSLLPPAWMSPVLEDLRDELAVGVSDAPREKSSCAHLANRVCSSVSTLSSAPPGSSPTSCPPRIYRTRPGGWRRIPQFEEWFHPHRAQISREGARLLLFLGSTGSHAVVAPSPSGRAQRAPLAVARCAALHLARTC